MDGSSVVSTVSRLWIAAALLVGGCATGNSRVSENVDPQTGVTIRATASLFVYLRDISEVADNVRDYVSVGAVEVNKTGTRTYYLAVVPGGPIDHRRATRIVLTLTGQPRELTLTTHEPRSLGIGEPPFRAEWGYIGEIWYAVTAAELRAFAATPPESIQLIEGGRVLTYVRFRRGDAALRDFIRDIPDMRPSAPQQH